MSKSDMPEAANGEQAELFDGRIWIDGCFDFSHHGHAGAMLQARRLGTSLYVGIHSDEEILANKGPTVMNLEERCAAADACRWSTVCVPNAPYVTYVPFISQYGCRYVVHGDDITSDSGGEDCYRFVKQAGRFKVVKRAPGISTTDLVGRMLLCTKSHFINNFVDLLVDESHASENTDQSQGALMRQRISDYASDETGHSPLVQVHAWKSSRLVPIVQGASPLPGQRVVYADGGFDLFTPGHIEFFRKIIEVEEQAARDAGWYHEEQVSTRRTATGRDYSPVYLVAGIHDDNTVNHWKGVNYPIMNIFERGLCVLQCKYVSAVVFDAPFEPTEAFLTSYSHPIQAVYHGPIETIPGATDPYRFAKALGLHREISTHKFAHIDATEIAQRIMKSRAMYEERQRAKGVKGIGEEAVRRREELERQQAERSAAR